MKKPLIILAIGIAMLAVSFSVFAAALSSPTVTGPEFMRTLWLIWTAVGVALTVVGVASAVMALYRRFRAK